MIVYAVNQVCDDEYGCTSVDAIFSSMEKAQDFVNAHQYQWGAWFMEEGETRNALTITAYNIDEAGEFYQRI